MTVLGVITQIRTTDIDESVGFYTAIPGFELEFRYADFYAGIRVGETSFHLKLTDEKDPSIEFVSSGGHFHLYFTTDNVEEKAGEFEGRGVILFKRPTVTPWGSKEFYVKDNQGHTLCFGGPG